MSTIRAVFHLVRVRQWAKNLLLFAGLVFAGRLRQAGPNLGIEIAQVLLAFLCFCALSGAAYIINDWVDLKRDRLHPVKRNRPLAAGAVSVQTALFSILFLLAFAALCTVIINRLNPATLSFSLCALGYFALTLAYSWVLKREVIVDVIALATGFVLRVVAGCLAIPVLISPWIIFCTFSLALFIGLCKRRAELNEIGDIGTREVLAHYPREMLDILIAVAAGLTIIGYSFYTFLASHTGILDDPQQSVPLLMATIPFVIYGVFRYLYLAISSPVGAEPERMLLDVRLMSALAIWSLIIVIFSIMGRI